MSKAFNSRRFFVAVDNYIDPVAAQCVNTLTPKWSKRLAAFDVDIWDHCYSMEQTLRIE
jgi:hypothetical protein